MPHRQQCGHNAMQKLNSQQPSHKHSQLERSNTPLVLLGRRKVFLMPACAAGADGGAHCIPPLVGTSWAGHCVSTLRLSM